MGRGNVCVSQPYEGLFYIDSGDYSVYQADDPWSEYPETRLAKELSYDEIASGEWLYDDIGSEEELDDIVQCFKQDFCKMFPSFKDLAGLPDKWVRNGSWGDFSRRVLLENRLFYICAEDNQWSTAVELVQKDGPWGEDYGGLQSRHYQRYLNGMRDCLLKRLPSVGTYEGAWTHGILTKDDLLRPPVTNS